MKWICFVGVLNYMLMFNVKDMKKCVFIDVKNGQKYLKIDKLIHLKILKNRSKNVKNRQKGGSGF